MINYQFVCKKCSPDATESFLKKQASFHQLCTTALANLIAVQRVSNDECEDASSNKRLFFSKDKDVIPFIEKNWEAMTSAPRRTKSTWHATISRSMTREDVFTIHEQHGELMYSLKDYALEKVGPYNENIKMTPAVAAGTPTSTPAPPQTSSIPPIASANVLQSSQALNTVSVSNSSSRRGSKRKASESTVTATAVPTFGNVGTSAFGAAHVLVSKKRNANDLAKLEKMIPTCYPNDHPFNKDGYRYHLVEPDPHSPLRQKFEETEFWAGKPLPGHLYRPFLEAKVALALHDRAPQLKIGDDRMTVSGEKGYATIRATHGVTTGLWYFEVNVKEKPGNSAVRFGWSQHLGNLQAPVGYDKMSYAWRSRKGTVFHDSVGKGYTGRVGFEAGDVLGALIDLGEVDCEANRAKLLPTDYKHMTLVKFKNHLYYEEKDNFSESEKSLKPRKGSQIVFYKNGECYGAAFNDVFDGIYYPAISLYKNATVTINFGPDFQHPPTNMDSWRPMSEAASESFVSYALGDLIYHATKLDSLD